MRYVFGRFELDIDRHELVDGSRPVSLRPRVFEVLAYLIENRERLVPKSELLDRFWGSNVGDEVLGSCIMSARRAVADDGRKQSIIKTIHGLGYRFVAPVVDPEDDSGDLEIQEKPVQNAELPELPASLESGGLPSAPVIKECKIVTVLACAIAEAETVVDRLGPEAMHALMEELFGKAHAILERFGGSILEWSGDGFLALFGVPVAHDDDVRRAIWAALELRSTSYGKRSCGDGCHLVVGVNTGPALIGDLDRIRTPGFYTARGSTTEIAMTLRAAATPGTVLASESTYCQIADEVEVEQRPTSPPCFAILRSIANRAGVTRRTVDGGSPFVGRKEEIAVLRERLDRAASGNGQVVGILGAPGIGKSRLLDVFVAGLPAGRMRQVEGRCLPYRKATPFSLMSDLARGLCGIDDTLDAEQAARQARQTIATSGGSGLDEELLLELTGVNAECDRSRHLSPQARRAKIFTLLERLIVVASETQPVVLAIEDLQWIDSVSEEWLSRFLGRIDDAPILFLGTARLPLRQDWLSRTATAHLVLPPLTSHDSLALVRSLSRSGKLEAKTAENLIARAEGNPFFLEELTRAIEMIGAPDAAAAIPDTVQAVLAARIDGLTHDEKRLLRVCSVVGATIRLPLLRSVSGLEERKLETTLDELEDTGFLSKICRAPERTYRFKHILTQEAAYRSVPRDLRTDLHARIAAYLERREGGLAANPGLLALHHERAGNLDKAVDCYQLAGRAAYLRSANEEAVGLAAKGLHLLADPAIGYGRDRRELTMQLTIAPALVAARGYGADEVKRAYTRAELLSEKLGDMQQSFRALVGLWNFHWVRGELDTAHAVAARLLNLADRAGDPALQLRAHAAMGEILFHFGEIEVSLEHLRRGTAMRDRMARRSRATQIPEVACLCYSAWARWHLGDQGGSQNDADEALTLAQGLSHPFTLALALALKAELHQFRLEVHECRDTAQEAVALSREHGFPFWEGTATILFGWALAMRGDFDRGHNAMVSGFETFVATGAGVQRTPWLGMLAEIEIRAGRHDDAWRMIEEAFSWAERTREGYYLPELHRLKGDLILGCGDADNTSAAERAYGTALRIARSQKARSREFRAAVALADLWTKMGRIEEAGALIEPYLSSRLPQCGEDARKAGGLLVIGRSRPPARCCADLR